MKCEKCGEELLGAVNRCWRCGAKVELDAQEAIHPPASLAAGPLAVPPREEPDEGVVTAALVQAPRKGAAGQSGRIGRKYPWK